MEEEEHLSEGEDYDIINADFNFIDPNDN